MTGVGRVVDCPAGHLPAAGPDEVAACVPDHGAAQFALVRDPAVHCAR
jgi:hypothetical protein